MQATLPVGYTFNNFNFAYDKVGNLLTLQNTAKPPPTNSIGGPWQTCYGYDDLYRLISSNGSFGSTVTSCTDATAGSTYTFSQSYDSIHNITHKTQTATQSSAVNPQTTYDFAYSYPAPQSPHPHGPTAIGTFTITNDADGNQINTQVIGTSDQSQYLYDEENRLSCANKGPQTPTPSCNAQGSTEFIYDQAGVRKIKVTASPTIYPNQYYTDFGGGTGGNQFKHIFIGSERILTKKARIAPDRQHWYYHPDHLGSTAMVTNEKSQLVDAVHYFPFGEVWFDEKPGFLPADYFFTAKEFDSETGFYDFGARYLDPRFSKWMTADPALGDYLSGKMGQGVFAPTHLALYTYGLNNPATYFDPNGLWTWGSVGSAAWSGVKKGAIGVGVGVAVVGLVVVAGPAIIGATATTVVVYTVVGAGAIAAGYKAGEVIGGQAIDVDVKWSGYIPVGVNSVSVRDLSVEDRVEGGAEVITALVGGYASGRAIGTVASRFGGKSPGPSEEPVAGRLKGCSFAEGTLVDTDDGLKSISELKVGDRVLARNEDTGIYAFQPITQIFRDEDPVKIYLTLEDPATGTTEVIATTPKHLFHVPGRGFVPAGSLKPDDVVSKAEAGTLSVVRLIRGQSGTPEVLRVKNLTFENQPFLAYDLEVGQDHTFFVGTIGVWVHNNDCDPVLKKIEEKGFSGVKRTPDGQGLDYAESDALYKNPKRPDVNPVQTLKYTGDYDADFEALNQQALGQKTTPRGYIWHHKDYNPDTNTGTAQLVNRDAHLGMNHRGGVADYKDAHEGQGYVWKERFGSK